MGVDPNRQNYLTCRGWGNDVPGTSAALVGTPGANDVIDNPGGPAQFAGGVGPGHRIGTPQRVRSAGELLQAEGFEPEPVQPGQPGPVQGGDDVQRFGGVLPAAHRPQPNQRLCGEVYADDLVVQVDAAQVAVLHLPDLFDRGQVYRHSVHRHGVHVHKLGPSG